MSGRAFEELEEILLEMESVKYADYPKVLALSQKATLLANELNAPAQLARAIIGAATTYTVTGKLDLATDHIMQAIKLAQAHNLPQIEAWALSLLSFHFQSTRDYRSARQLLERQREIAYLLNDNVLHSATLIDLGHLYFYLNEPHRSIEVLNEALTITSPQFFNGAMLSFIHLNLTMVYGHQKQAALLIEHGNKAIQWAKTANSPDLISYGYIYLADGYLASNMDAEAQDCLNMAREIMEPLDLPSNHAIYKDIEGRLMAKQQKFADSVMVLEEALEIAEQHQLFETEAQIYESLIKTHMLSGNMEAALDCQRLLYKATEKTSSYNFEQRLEILHTIFSMSLDRHREALQQMKPQSLTPEIDSRLESIHMALDEADPPTGLRREILNRLSHEFRTPLAVIGLGADILSRYHDRMSDTQRKSHLDRIQDRIAWMTSMLDNILLLLQLSRGLHDLPIQAININEVIERVREVIERFYGSSSRVEWNIEETVSSLAADADLLREILVQLLSNALKFSSEPVRLDIQSQDNHLHIMVTDLGTGIPAGEIDKVKEIFYRVENLGEIPGYGIGLAIVDQAVNACGGKWNIISEQSKGTQVSVSIPMRESIPA